MTFLKTNIYLAGIHGSPRQDSVRDRHERGGDRKRGYRGGGHEEVNHYLHISVI